jgi:hypothetical protein
VNLRSPSTLGRSALSVVDFGVSGDAFLFRAAASLIGGGLFSLIGGGLFVSDPSIGTDECLYFFSPFPRASRLCISGATRWTHPF